MKRLLVVSTAGADEPWLIAPAAQLAQETGAQTTVLVVDDVESQRFEPLPRDAHILRAAETAERIAGLFAEAGVGAEQLVRSGPAADTAIEVADELGADLIVVGSSPRRAKLKRLVGSLPFELVQRSGRQVLVVTEPG
jgi:nucleotide-binding universal stress UspA family protein